MGVAALLIVWELASLVVSSAILASPVDTAVALGRLAWEGTLWVQLAITLKRLVVGLAAGVLVGLGLGVLAGLRPGVRPFFEPFRWVAMTIPAVVIALLAMLWFGLGDKPVMFIVAFIVLPTMYVNTEAGVRAIDPRLVEVGEVYHFSRRLLFGEVYLPGIAAPALAGLTLCTGIGVRAVVLAEVLGAMSGIGHAFARASSFINTPEIYAWVVVTLGLMALLESGVLRPLRRRAFRWMGK